MCVPIWRRKHSPSRQGRSDSHMHRFFVCVQSKSMPSTERGNRMTTEELASNPLPGWLEPDNDSVPPEALRAVYARIADREVTKVCERARAAMRDAYVDGILAVHQVLAPLALFKEWCLAAGLNYRTAQSIVARAEHAERRKQEQASETAMPTRSLAREDSDGGGDDEADD